MTTDLGPVGEVDGETWRTVLGLAPSERPVAVVVEGSWWRAERVRRRLGRLETSRELRVPDLFIATHEGRALLYACLYGAPRAAEVVHIAARAGARLAVQIGSCGIVGQDVRPGDVIVPTEVLTADGVARHYVDADRVTAAEPSSAGAATYLTARGVGVHRGRTVSWPTLFNQPTGRAHEWRRQGCLGVDMETATTLAVADHFGIAGVSMLVAWDDLLAGRTFLDPLPDDLASAFERADEAVFDVALDLIGRNPEDAAVTDAAVTPAG